jgi:hypothetical protein
VRIGIRVLNSSSYRCFGSSNVIITVVCIWFGSALFSL